MDGREEKVVVRPATIDDINLAFTLTKKLSSELSQRLGEIYSIVRPDWWAHENSSDIWQHVRSYLGEQIGHLKSAPEVLFPAILDIDELYHESDILDVIKLANAAQNNKPTTATVMPYMDMGSMHSWLKNSFAMNASHFIARAAESTLEDKPAYLVGRKSMSNIADIFTVLAGCWQSAIGAMPMGNEFPVVRDDGYEPYLRTAYNLADDITLAMGIPCSQLLAKERDAAIWLMLNRPDLFLHSAVGSSAKAPFKRKGRGRPGRTALERIEDIELDKAWKIASSSRVTKAAFCRDKRISVEDLNKTLDRVRNNPRNKNG